MTFRGTQAAIQFALDGLSYQAASAGTVQLTVTTSDSGLTGYGPGLGDTKSVTITVDGTNQPPLITGLSPSPLQLVVTEGTSVSFIASAFDPEGGQVTFSLVAPSVGSIGSNSGLFSWQTAGSPSGVYNVTIRAADPAGAEDVATYSITVLDEPSGFAPLNDPGMTVPDQNITGGDTLVFRVQVENVPSGDIDSFEILNAPSGAQFDAATGVFLWSPEESQDNDSYTSTIILHYGDDETLQDDFTITVADKNLEPTILRPSGGLGGSFFPEQGFVLQESGLFDVFAFNESDLETRNVRYQLGHAHQDDDVAIHPEPHLPADVEFSKVSGPSGLTVSSEGLIEWPVGPEVPVDTYVLLVEIRNLGEGEYYHQVEIPIRVSNDMATPSRAPAAVYDDQIATLQHRDPSTLLPGVTTFDLHGQNGEGGLLDNDETEGSSEIQKQNPSKGTLGFNAGSGVFTYTASSAASAAGRIPFSYHIVNEPNSNSATAAIIVTNEKPRADKIDSQGIEYPVAAGGQIFIPLSNHVSDVEADPIQAAAGSFPLPPAAGSAAIVTHNGQLHLRYTAGSTPGYDSFVYLVDDAFDEYPVIWPEASADSRAYHDGDQHGFIRIQITAPTNTPPVANPDSYELHLATTPELSIPPNGVLGNDTDPQPLTAVLDTPPADELTDSFVFRTDGSFDFTPASGYVGTVTFTYYAHDGGAFSDPATVTIDVIGPYGDRLNPEEAPQECSCACACGDFSFQPQKQTGGLTGNLQAGEPGGPMLHYATPSNPHPTFVLEAPLLSAYANPSAVQAQVFIEGLSSPTVFYDASALQAGDDELRFVTTFDATTLPTGSYSYDYVLTNTYTVSPGVTRNVSQAFKGRVNIVNRIDSEFGNRWSLAGLDRLYVQSGAPGVGGALLTLGGGNSFWYADNGGDTLLRPEGEPSFSKLVATAGGYQLTTPHGLVSTFNAAGLLISRSDPNDNVTFYTYADKDNDGQFDEITSITDPFQRTTTFVYNGPRVAQIIDFAGRVTTLNYNLADNTLLSVTKPDPDGAGSGVDAPVNRFGYHANTHLMTSWADATTPVGEFKAVFAYDGAQRITSIAENDHTNFLTATQSLGWYNTTIAGSEGTQSNPGPTFDRRQPGLAYGSYTEHGITSQFQVDRFGHETAMVDAIGHNFTHGRDFNGLPTNVLTPGPHDIAGVPPTLSTLHSYDSQGNLLLQTLPTGDRRHWEYEPEFSQATRYIDELGRITLYEIQSGTGNLLSMRQVIGAIDPGPGGDDLKWSYTYTTAGVRGLLASVTDPLLHVTQYEYFTDFNPSRHGQLRKVIYADGSFEEYGYDNRGNVASVQDAEGRTTVYTYDQLDRVTSVTLPAIELGGFQAVIQYAYDSADRLTSVLDADLNRTVYQYDHHGRLEKIIEEHPTDRNAAQKPTTTLHYDEDTDWLIGMTDPLGRRTDYGHDDLGRVITVTLPKPQLSDPESARSTYTTVYGALGNVLQEIDADLKETHYEYDDRGRVTKVTLPHDGVNGAAEYTTVYDAAGQILKETDPLGRETRYRYDTLRRLVRTHNPATGTTSFAYDKNSNLISQTDAVGHTTEFLYDARDRQTQIKDPRNGLTKFEYDKVHNLTKLTDPSNNATTFAYNNWDLLKQETNQLGASRVYVYGDSNGNLTRVTDRNLRVTEYDYDFQHRLIRERWLGVGARTITSTYDFADQLTNISDPDSTYGYTYDRMGRATTITNADALPFTPTVVLTQTFDKLSRRTGLSATIGGVADFVNAYQYDPLSRMKQVTQTGQGGNAVAAKRVDFQYNLLGQFTRIDRYAGLGTSPLIASTNYAYEPGTQRLASLKHSTTITVDGTGDLARYTWGYDTLGRVRTFFSANDSNDTATYFYDQTDQLTAVSHSVLTTENENYGYDLSGNRTDGQFDADPNNRLASDGRFSYGYDAEGNLTSRQRLVSNTNPNDPNTTLYTWDHRNRLTSVEFKDASGATTKRVQYTYDVFDRRVGKAVDTTFPFDMVNAQVERYVFDGPELALAFNGTGTLTNRYLHGPVIDQILADESFDATPGQPQDIAWPLADNLGSVRDVIFFRRRRTFALRLLRRDRFRQPPVLHTPFQLHRPRVRRRRWALLLPLPLVRPHNSPLHQRGSDWVRRSGYESQSIRRQQFYKCNRPAWTRSHSVALRAALHSFMVRL